MSTSSKHVQGLREKTDSELEYDAKQLAKELFELRFKSSSEGLANPSRIREIRRDVARIQTILNERRQGTRGAQPRS
jgi:large subunit ribosomal protein L29